MSHLFIDLYQYRQRELKNNLEDWFTECLAAALRALTSQQWQAFLESIIGDPAPSIAELLAVSTLSVGTQVQAGGTYGIPDLVIYADDSPIILFENKVSHSVAQAENEAGEVRHQLHRYAEWLSESQYNGTFRKLLIFLTHITSPPEDFGSSFGSTCPYRNLRRRQFSWGVISRILLEITSHEGERSLAHGLALALYAMLEDEGMANEFPTLTALASLEVFLSQGGEIENLVRKMWDRVKFAVNCGNRERESFETEFEYGRCTVWRYANKIDRFKTKDAFLMTGLWFPEVVDLWGPDELEGHEPTGTQVFLQFADNNDDVFADVEGKPTADWYRPHSDFLRMKPLHDFGGSPDKRAAQILEWLETEARALREFLMSANIIT